MQTQLRKIPPPPKFASFLSSPSFFSASRQKYLSYYFQALLFVSGWVVFLLLLVLLVLLTIRGRMNAPPTTTTTTVFFLVCPFFLLFFYCGGALEKCKAQVSLTISRYKRLSLLLLLLRFLKVKLQRAFVFYLICTRLRKDEEFYCAKRFASSGIRCAARAARPENSQLVVLSFTTRNTTAPLYAREFSFC